MIAILTFNHCAYGNEAPVLLAKQFLCTIFDPTIKIYTKADIDGCIFYDCPKCLQKQKRTLKQICAMIQQMFYELLIDFFNRGLAKFMIERKLYDTTVKIG